MDMDRNKLKGEMLDLQQGAAFLRNARIQESPDGRYFNEIYSFNSLGNYLTLDFESIYFGKN